MGRYPEKKTLFFWILPNYLFCYLVLFQAVHHGIWFFRTRLQENYTSIVLRCLVVCYCFFSMKSNTCRIAATALDLWRTSLASGLASSHGKRELSGRRTNTPCLLPRVVGGKRVLSTICRNISTPCPSCPHLPLTRRTSSSTHGGDPGQ